MKRHLFLTLIIGLAWPAIAAEREAGPRGGRLLALEGGRAELLIEPDRNLSIVFYDEKLQKVTLGSQVATAVAEIPTGKAKIEFRTQDDALVSTHSLPDGSGYTIVVQIRPAPNGKPKNFRLTYDTGLCSGCQLAEYACICDH